MKHLSFSTTSRKKITLLDRKENELVVEEQCTSKSNWNYNLLHFFSV